DSQPRALLGSRRATRPVRKQFVPQLGFLLHGLQRPEAGTTGRGFPAPALPRGPLVAERSQRPPPSPARPRRRQAPPTGFRPVAAVLHRHLTLECGGPTPLFATGAASKASTQVSGCPVN